MFYSLKWRCFRYSWRHNRVPLDFNRPNIKRGDSETGTLVIDPATSLDEGYYQCFAANQYGTALSEVAHLQRATISSFPGGFTNCIVTFLWSGRVFWNHSRPAVFGWRCCCVCALTFISENQVSNRYWLCYVEVGSTQQ